MAARAIERAEADAGISVAHYDLRFLKPLDEELLHEVGKKFRHIVTIEDGIIKGGMGMRHTRIYGPITDIIPEIRRIGVPDQFIEHGSVQQLYHLCGMDEEGIYKVITKNELRMDAPVESCMATHS